MVAVEKLSESDALSLRFRRMFGWLVLYSGFSSLLRFVPVAPNVAAIMLTGNCNCRCVTCGVWKNTSVNELTTEEMKCSLRQLKGIGVKTLVFVGGEPLLRNDIGAIVKEASSLGFDGIIVVTNGLLLEKKAEELLDSGVTHIDVSIDAVGEADDRIKGISGHYERAIAGIRAVQRLKQTKGLDVAVTIMTNLLMDDNVDYIPDLVNVARSMGAYLFFNLLEDHIVVFRGIPLSKLLVKDERKVDQTIDFLETVNKKYPGLLSQCNPMLEYVRNYLKGKNRYDFHCAHGFHSVFLGPHGEIYPCWALEPIGNVRVNNLSEVVGSERQRALAEKMYKMDCPGCTNEYGANILIKHLIAHKLFCEKASVRAKLESLF